VRVSPPYLLVYSCSVRREILPLPSCSSSSHQQRAELVTQNTWLTKDKLTGAGHTNTHTHKCSHVSTHELLLRTRGSVLDQAGVLHAATIAVLGMVMLQLLVGLLQAHPLLLYVHCLNHSNGAVHSRHRYRYGSQDSVGIKGPCDWGQTQSSFPMNHASKAICQQPNHHRQWAKVVASTWYGSPHDPPG
jgi:hypothetical protein